MQKFNMRRPWIPLAVMTYLVLAISWWSVLLFRKNEAFFLAEASSISCQVSDPGTLKEEMIRIEQKHQRQKVMILGESLFLTLSVLAGIYLITRAYRKEFRIARQQQNFLLSITHELRSPIAAIRLNLETLRRKELPEDKRELLIKSALTEDERLEVLIDKLLLAARIESDTGLHKTQISVNTWLNETTDHFKRKWPDIGIVFMKAPENIMIEADKEALYSAIGNVVENAVKYAGQAGDIEIRAIAHEDGAEITVSDKGPGVPENERKAIFDKFYRIGDEETRRSKGTGLGLFIARKLMEGHGGRIWVSDRPGGGSIFHLWLPGKPMKKEHYA